MVLIFISYSYKKVIYAQTKPKPQNQNRAHIALIFNSAKNKYWQFQGNVKENWL